MRGRYPAGVDYVDKLDGAAADKGRLKAILQTLAGEARLLEVCDHLGIRATRFHQLRQRALQAALDALAPRPAGRPSLRVTPEAERIDALEQALAEKELQLHEALVRAEVAVIVAPRIEAEPEKRGRCATVKLRKQKPR
jgi:hypothetical protein